MPAEFLQTYVQCLTVGKEENILHLKMNLHPKS